MFYGMTASVRTCALHRDEMGMAMILDHNSPSLDNRSILSPYEAIKSRLECLRKNYIRV
jgi:hypothetical protein